MRGEEPDMPKKSTDTGGYDRLKEAIKSGSPDKFYIFHGDERYLLERSLESLRKLLCPDGPGSFNYKRFTGGSVSADDIEDAVITMPAFADRTLVEVHDFDIFMRDEPRQKKLSEILADLPDFVCIVFIYDSLQYKPDGRVKINAEILKNAQVVEFALQEHASLVKWIKVHFASAGKNIGGPEASHLAAITGGYMSALNGEIEKIAAYATGETITRADIDAVVTPVLDAVVYRLTDAIAGRDHVNALRILDELFQMQEAPHKLIYTISLKMRQLLAAKTLLDNGSGVTQLMEICGIRKDMDFIARSLLGTARKMTLTECRDAILYCAGTAFELNSSPEPEARLIELVVKLASMHRI